MYYSLSSVYKSLVRQVELTRKAIVDQGVSPEMEYYAWDSRGEISEQSHKDLIGLAGWSFQENGGLWVIRCGITISTYNDENLFRELQILDVIHDHWGERASIPMVHPTTGELYTNLSVVDFDVMPTGQSERRNYRPVGLELLRTDG